MNDENTTQSASATEVGRYERHVFVCLNQRADGHARGCCQESGGGELHAQLKAMIKARHLKTQVRINRSGCLDVCELGPAMVIYPENIWYGRVTEQDLEEIVDEHLVGGRPVERLRLNRQQLRPWEKSNLAP